MKILNRNLFLSAFLILLLLLSPFLISINSLQAQPVGINAALLEKVVENRRKFAAVPGASVVVTGPEGIVYENTFGSFPSNDTPVFIGSTSKSITAIAILKLIDQGKLSLEDNINHKLLGELGINIEATQANLQVKNLLTHTSGISTLSGHWDGEGNLRIGDIEFTHSVGEYNYSSMNYILLGKIIEEVSQMSYAEYMQTEIFQPLGMNSTYTSLEEAKKNGFENGNQYLFLFSQNQEPPQISEPLVPMGFIITSPKDLGRFNQFILNKGNHNGTQVITKETMALLYQSWEGEEFGITYGFGVGRSDGLKVINNNGLHHSFSSSIYILPDYNYAVSVITNNNSLTFASEVNQQIANVLAGQEASFALSVELIVRVIVGIFLLFDFIGLAKKLILWLRLGRPNKFSLTSLQKLKLIFLATHNVIILILIMKYFHFPLWWLLTWQPDIGWAAVISLIIAIPAAILNAFIWTKEPSYESGIWLNKLLGSKL